ncbi:MAG: hypothetical protein ACJAYU_001500, partial [Bradymonadia bacterium]
MSGFLNQQNNQGQTKNLFLATLLMFAIVFVYTSFVTPPPARVAPAAADGSGEEEVADGTSGETSQDGSGDAAEPATVIEVVNDVPELPP